MKSIIFLAHIFLFSLVVRADTVVKKIDNLNQTLSNIGQQDCSTCLSTTNAAKIPKPDFESERAPITDVNPIKGIESVSSYSHTNGYEYAVSEPSKVPEYISFYNYGPNKIVPKTNPEQSRQWSFNAEAWARQDIYISIMDQPNDISSQLQNSYLYLFPRKFVPSIKRDGDKFIVTLPTGEKAYFDAKTKEVLADGILKENGPITKGGRIPDPPKVTYTGAGVLIRVDSRGVEPRKGGFATVTKPGQKPCKVPSSDLWPDQSTSSAFHFKYATDADLNSYLQKKCKFGID